METKETAIQALAARLYERTWVQWSVSMKKRVRLYGRTLSRVIFQCRLFAEYGIDNMGICLVVLSSVEAILQVLRSNSNAI